MGKVRLTNSARRDLEDIWAYIAIDNCNPKAADSLVDQFDERFRLLAVRQEIGEDVSSLRPNTRRSVVKERYLVFYEPQFDGILVLRILHGARLIQPQDIENG